jgi:hypothetical protein
LFLFLPRGVEGFEQQRFDGSIVLGAPLQKLLVTMAIPSTIDLGIEFLNVCPG